ncbi:hypothetical protein Y032_0002g816 [Ancylostoma ceylanicum]|nr:hypothetical protein Y032_0002g816 [Ancylostoma ceylanicum]
MIMSFSRLQKESCEYILQDNNTMTTLQNAHFDVGITEVFAACGFGLFEMVDIPHVIGASAVGMFDSMNEFVHVPTMPSFVPSFLSSFDEKMTFPQRFVNFFLHNIVWLATQHILHSYERLFSRYGFDTNLQQLINTRVNYVLSNSDEFLDIAQPSTGKLVHIGGIALPEATTLPKDFQLVMGRKGSKGVVLISFGSNAPTVQMPANMRVAILEAVSHFPEYTFIWKIDKEDAVPEMPNLFTTSWVPQTALLELTAVMNRFELDVVAATAPTRARSKSEPTAKTTRPSRTLMVRSCEEVYEDDPDASAPLHECGSSVEPVTPPAATSERKKRTMDYYVPRTLPCLSRAPFEDRFSSYQIQDHWRGPLTRSSTSGTRQCTGYIWSGELPPRNYSNPTFSSKIFVGGVPWDITESALIDAFSPYGNCRVEWPCKEVRSPRSNLKTRGKVTGYVYMVFETERSVRSLLQDCSQEFGSAGEWYFKLKARRNQTSEIRQVQVIPWVVSDSSYNDDPSCHLDPKKTVFVGALHGMLTAHVLFSIMNELYGNVVFVGIDTDKYKYPIGSGRVTFRSHLSYFRAIESAFLEIRTSKFSKKVQIDPFLEDSCCMVCGAAQGPYFCRDNNCFRYFCGPCWQTRHMLGGKNADHRPLMRHAPRSPLARTDAFGARSEPVCSTSQRRFFPPSGTSPVQPLGGLAAVAAVAHGTVPRHQHHAYQYMQLPPSYTAMYKPTVMHSPCRVTSNMSPTPLLSGLSPTHSVNTSSSYVQQRLY